MYERFASDGRLWLMGLNERGALGTNNFTSRSSPVQTISGGNNWTQVSCGYRHTAAIKTDGTLWSWKEPLDELKLWLDEYYKDI